MTLVRKGLTPSIPLSLQVENPAKGVGEGDMGVSYEFRQEQIPGN